MKKHFVLNNNLELPLIAIGTWKVKNILDIDTIIRSAINFGYRHIDTAAKYENEKHIGDVIKKNNIDRNNLFITSKLWVTDRGYLNTIKAFEKTLENLNTDYLDLYLIHWPARKEDYDDYNEINIDTWRALEYLYNLGKVKAIGVSNFNIDDLDNLIDNCDVVPMVNQIEFHPGFKRFELIEYCEQKNIQVEAWSPLGHGEILENEQLRQIASKYKKSVAQICLRWSLQHNIIPIPKSISPERIKENIDIFDFEISEIDMKKINNLKNTGKSI